MPIGMFLAAITLILASAQQPPDGPFVIINKRPDEIWLVPLTTVRDQGSLRVATVVAVYPSQPAYSKADELDEVVETDNVLEIDCGGQLMRPASGGATYDLGGRRVERGIPAVSTAWQPIPPIPPFVFLDKIVCERLDVSAITRPSLRQAIPGLRAELQY